MKRATDEFFQLGRAERVGSMETELKEVEEKKMGKNDWKLGVFRDVLVKAPAAALELVMDGEEQLSGGEREGMSSGWGLKRRTFCSEHFGFFVHAHIVHISTLTER